MRDSHAPAAAGHILIRGAVDQAGIHEHLADAPSGAVPSAPGTSGNQEVNVHGLGTRIRFRFAVRGQ